MRRQPEAGGGSRGAAGRRSGTRTKEKKASEKAPPAEGAVWNNIVPSRQAQRELKAEALLRASVAAFNRHGFHQTSLDDIARELGVTKAALYHYFPNKNALLAACFDRAMAVAAYSVETARVRGRNGREKVILMFRTYLERMIDDLGECILLVEENALEPRERAALIAERDRIEYTVRDFVREGIADGSIVSCDPKLATFLLFGAVNWVPKWFLRKGSWGHQQLAEAMAGMLDRMLSTSPSPRLETDIGRKVDAGES